MVCGKGVFGVIKRLIIQNFESHKETIMEFHPGTNAITGESDEGKSAVIRFLKWMFFHEPLGDNYVSWWSDNGVSGSVEFLDGTIIRKSRNKSGETYYYLGEVEYRVTEKKVPEPIQRIFNITKLNFQEQHDALFLLSYTDGEVARLLNEIVDLSVIDRSLSKANSEIQSTKKELDRQRENKEEAFKNLKEVGWIVKAGKELKEVEGLFSKRMILEEQEKVLEDMILVIEYSNKELNSYREVIVFKKKVEEIEGILDEIPMLSKEEETIYNLVRKVQETTKSVEKAREIAKYSKDVELIELDGELLEEMQIELREFDGLLDEVDYTEKMLKQKRSLRDNLKKKFQEEMGEECPLCGNPI
jgi:DNA repair protein SbcC/Rad50